MVGVVPDLSHLTGRDMEKVAEALTSSNLKAVLASLDQVRALKTEELHNISELVAAAAGKCGGIGCG
jgi:hypothetical protein